MRFGIVLAQSQPSVKVVQITDRDRARAREAVRDKEERLVVRTDTVYIEKRDSSLRLSSLGASCAPQVLRRASSESGLQEDGTPTVSGKLSAVSKILKWFCALICAVVVLILVIRLKC